LDSVGRYAGHLGTSFFKGLLKNLKVVKEKIALKMTTVFKGQIDNSRLKSCILGEVPRKRLQEVVLVLFGRGLIHNGGLTKLKAFEKALHESFLLTLDFSPGNEEISGPPA
jgi:hypothetical protein